MIDDPRDPRTTYKVEEGQDGYFSVTSYPAQMASDNGLVRSTHKDNYRKDMLPQWMIDGMKLLDTAGKDCTVKPVGAKRGNEYWFWAQQYWDTEKTYRTP